MMEHEVVIAVPGKPPGRGILTTARAESSYGIPVAVLEGIAYGSAEVLWIDGSKDTWKAAEQAGYKILSDADSRWDSVTS
ncbi:hypothetical protein ES705_32266 [subsurface metagenome]